MSYSSTSLLLGEGGVHLGLVGAHDLIYGAVKQDKRCTCVYVAGNPKITIGKLSDNHQSFQLMPLCCF